VYPSIKQSNSKNTKAFSNSSKKTLPYINILTKTYEAYAPKSTVKMTAYLSSNPRYIRVETRQVPSHYENP